MRQYSSSGRSRTFCNARLKKEVIFERGGIGCNSSLIFFGTPLRKKPWAPASAGMTDRDLACTQFRRNWVPITIKGFQGFASPLNLLFPDFPCYGELKLNMNPNVLNQMFPIWIVKPSQGQSMYIIRCECFIDSLHITLFNFSLTCLCYLLYKFNAILQFLLRNCSCHW